MVDGGVEIAVEDERGKLDLNAAAEETLARLARPLTVHTRRARDDAGARVAGGARRHAIVLLTGDKVRPVRALRWGNGRITTGRRAAR